jgi:hypothetical protein
MGGGNQIYVVATHSLELKHHPAKLLVADLPALTQVGQIIVLAKNALQITIGKKR